MLQASERPKRTASRVHGCRKILGEIVRLRGKVERAATGRVQSDVELQWLGSAADALETLITAGTAVLPGLADPRDTRVIKKTDLASYRADQRWEREAFGP